MEKRGSGVEHPRKRNEALLAKQVRRRFSDPKVETLDCSKFKANLRWKKKQFIRKPLGG